MKNHVQPGDSLSLIAPTGGVVSGTAYLLNNLFVVALATVAQTLAFEGRTRGVFTLPKEAPLVINQGDKLYWDNTNKVLTKTSSGNTLVGACAVAAASSDTTVAAWLPGIVV